MAASLLLKITKIKRKKHGTLLNYANTGPPNLLSKVTFQRNIRGTNVQMFESKSRIKPNLGIHYVQFKISCDFTDSTHSLKMVKKLNPKSLKSKQFGAFLSKFQDPPERATLLSHLRPRLLAANVCRSLS